MPVHTEGVKETSRSGLRCEAWGCRVPSMVRQLRQLLVILGVASSLTLVALGGSDPVSEFWLRIPSFGRPHGNHGAHFGYGSRIPWCIGHKAWGVRCHVKSFLLCLQSRAALPPQLFHRRAIKLAWSLLHNLQLPALCNIPKFLFRNVDHFPQ
jgi:hypothetical protein